jgi:hypothetical protein
VHDKGADFPAFFRKYYYLPYDDWSSLDHKHFNFVIRFENLSNDFIEVLRRIGIEPKRPLPAINTTKQRESDFWSYYTPPIRNRAKWVFGPYFRKWDYSFPDDWGPGYPPMSDVAYSVANIGRQLYWRYLR